MKGQNEFTTSQIDQIKNLISDKVRTTPDKQKGIRAKIRKLGFYYSDFCTNKDGYTVADFEELIRLGQIKVIGGDYKPITQSAMPIKKEQTTKIISATQVSTTDVVKVEISLMNDKDFKSAATIDRLVPSNAGLYCIRITDINKLPKPLNTHLTDRGNNIIYIGIATESLQTRLLKQELRAKGHGTFFRSIGAVLGHRPPKGSLVSKKNKRNFKFSKIDEKKIIKWNNDNLIVNWVDFSGDYESIETELITKYKPLINLSKNPLALQLLSDLRKECVEIANTK